MDESESVRKNNNLLLLLGFRATLAVFGIFAIIAKPIETALVALVVLGVLALVGEAYYKSQLALEEHRLRVQKESERRRRLAEEARLKFEAFKKAQEESADKYMVFGSASETESGTDSSPGGQNVNTVSK